MISENNIYKVDFDMPGDDKLFVGLFYPGNNDGNCFLHHSQIKKTNPKKFEDGLNCNFLSVFDNPVEDFESVITACFTAQNAFDILFFLT